METDNLKILILCKQKETLEQLAKAICLKYPTATLFFAQTIEGALAKHGENTPDILVLMSNQFVVKVAPLVSQFLSMHSACSVILITCYSSGEEISKCLSLGVKDILTAPLNFDLFLYKLAGIIRLHHEPAR